MRNKNHAANGRQKGFTLTEIMIVAAMIAILAGIGIPYYTRSVETAKEVTAIQDIKEIMEAIEEFQRKKGKKLPKNLDEIGLGGLLDPWGNPYQYLPFSTGLEESGKNKGKGKGSVSIGLKRKDKNLVPINSDFDLYSKGPDGASVGPLTAAHSRDDIIRADDGGFVGIAQDY